mmetsp:Transcript_65805/g.133854  ORF Transcript_65805/g.133854 Transcript_65805/m.133854 type:complete len:360 (+) Transcript_65805:180-1259(+)
MADAAIEVEKVIVVGMNRTRLLKIMAMIDEDGVAEDENHRDVEYVPCVAQMASYEGEDGEDIRYMSSFVYHDGSTMSKFFDDEGFQESYSTVIMVGYEWKESDDELVRKYFEANLLAVDIRCVAPNPGFLSLSDEMCHFKNLSSEEKEEHASNRTMGPRKMQQFILEMVRSSKSTDDSKENKNGESETGEDDGAEGTDKKSGTEEASESKEEENVEKKRTPGFNDYKTTTFACRMCRTVLFGEDHLAPDHIQNQHSFRRKSNQYQQSFGKSGASPCQSLFCDESVLEWLAPEGADVEGKLTCPKCSYKVGHWNWAGAQCSCGTWVVPAIQIPLGKVDIILPPSERRKISPVVIVGPTVY